jgi:uncharacterized protein (TIGR02453 family)
MPRSVFTGFTPRTIEFLWNLRFNNEKVWFEAHRDEFKRDLQVPMRELCLDVFERVTAGRERCSFSYRISHIYKDARRVRGGAFYRDHMWFSIQRSSDKITNNPGYWFEVTPDGWSYGMGYYQAKPETMAKMRARIDRDPKVFEKLVSFFYEQDEFSLEGTEYARKKEAPTEKTADWYNKKSFSLYHKQPIGDELFSAGLTGRIAGGMLSLTPFYDYLISLDSDPAPAR